MSCSPSRAHYWYVAVQSSVLSTEYRDRQITAAALIRMNPTLLAELLNVDQSFSLHTMATPHLPHPPPESTHPPPRQHHPLRDIRPWIGSRSYGGWAQRKRQSVRVTSPGFSRCPCTKRASSSRRSGPAEVSNSQSSSSISAGAGHDGSTPSSAHSASIGRQSPFSQRLYSSGR